MHTNANESAEAAGACGVFQLGFLPAPDVYDVWKAQVGFSAALQQEGPPKGKKKKKKSHAAAETAVPLAGPRRAELMWVISEQCTCAIITVVSLLLRAALYYHAAIHPHDKWRDMENYT